MKFISSSVFHFDRTNVSFQYRYTSGFQAAGRVGQGSAPQPSKAEIPKGTRAGQALLFYLFIPIEMTDLAL